MALGSERGNALTMVTLVSIGVSAGLIALSGKHSNRAKSASLGQLKASRDTVFGSLRSIMTAPAALQMSAMKAVEDPDIGPGNVALANCLYESGANDCLATGANTFVGFQLFDEFGTIFSTPWPQNLKNITMEAGPNGPRWPEMVRNFRGLPFPAPQFDRKAVRCPADKFCPVAPYTAFRAWCPYPVSPHGLASPNEDGVKDIVQNRPVSCDQAEFLQFFIAVGGNKKTTDAAEKIPGMVEFPTKNNFADSSPSSLGSRTREPDEILVTVDEANNEGARLCPTGMSTVGVDSNGYPRCQFAINPCVVRGDAAKGQIIAAFENGNLVCRKPFEGESCSELEVFYGVTSDGRMDCRRPKFNTGCEKDQIAVEFDKDGNPVCIRAHTGQACPEPSILIGFDADGIAVCKQAGIIFAGIPLTPYWKKKPGEAPPPVEKIISKEQKAFTALCSGCHEVIKDEEKDKNDPSYGPTIDEIIALYQGKPEEIVIYAKNPVQKRKGKKMPVINNVDADLLTGIANWILNAN